MRVFGYIYKKDLSFCCLNSKFKKTGKEVFGPIIRPYHEQKARNTFNNKNNILKKINDGQQIPHLREKA
jgi:hypothetical protein